MPDIYSHTANVVRNIYDRRIDTPAVLDADRYFPDGSRFVQSWQQIRDEALAIASRLHAVPRFHELMSAQEAISANDGHDWRVFVLKAFGHDVRENLERCPVTAELLRRCPSVLSASYSFLAPGKHIPPHRGPFRGVVRFHLGLSMPLGEDGQLGAILWVDGVEHRLDNGDSLLWDDTFTHEVLNATNHVRIALLLDVWRAEMPADMIALSHLIVAGARLAAYVGTATFFGLKRAVGPLQNTASEKP
ncbi:MAG: aspartyl/asparaginyl beta-hydroxylase domain-containing protein [Rhizomicrobium sp.]|jgi:aspartate beta-hydroxylase